MTRAVALLALVATLGTAASASAALQPIRQLVGRARGSLLRAGTLRPTHTGAGARVTVIVTLRRPPLAAWHRTLAGRAGRARLNVRSGSARAYVASLAAAQRAAVRRLRAIVPEATVSRHYRVLLNGFAAEVPARSLPRVLKLTGAAKVYPSYRYTQALDR